MYRGVLIQDDNCEEPCLPNEIKMFIFSNKYNFGTEHDYKPEEVFHKYRFKKYKILPLYAYIHSDISLSLNNDEYPFNDRWDAGQLGLIVVPNKNKWIKDLDSIIKEYNQWLSCDTWGFIIYDENDNEIDSIWNYYGYKNAEEDMNCILKELNGCDN